MRTTRQRQARIAAAALVLGGLAAIHGLVIPPQARADAVYRWGISNAGETCGSTCGADNICCKIVIVKM